MDVRLTDLVARLPAVDSVFSANAEMRKLHLTDLEEQLDELGGRLKAAEHLASGTFPGITADKDAASKALAMTAHHISEKRMEVLSLNVLGMLEVELERQREMEVLLQGHA